MKKLILMLAFTIPLLVNAQTKKPNVPEKDKVYIVSATPTMDADFKNGFKISIRNTSKKKIVAFKLTFDFSDRKKTNDFDDRSGCEIHTKLKVSMNPNTTKSYIVKDMDANKICSYKPLVIIDTIVYSDGSFDKLTPDTSDFRPYN